MFFVILHLSNKNKTNVNTLLKNTFICTQCTYLHEIRFPKKKHPYAIIVSIITTKIRETNFYTNNAYVLSLQTRTRI